MSDRADSAQFKVAGLTDGRYLPFKGESLIKEDAKVANSFRSRNGGSTQLNGLRK